MVETLQEHVARGEPVLLLAHFRATLADICQQLDRVGISPRMFPAVINSDDVNGIYQKKDGPIVNAGLVRQLVPDPFSPESSARLLPRSCRRTPFTQTLRRGGRANRQQFAAALARCRFLCVSTIP